MSSEIHKYIETAIEKKTNLFESKVLDFPKEKKSNVSENLQFRKKNHWSINDNSNKDQLKAVTGICLIFGFLLVTGLFANLTLI